MDDKIYDLLIKILDSDLLRDTKDQIVRFYMLPRNTPVQPMLEVGFDDEDEFGTIQRPSAHDAKRKKNPKLAETEDAMTDTLKSRVK